MPCGCLDSDATVVSLEPTSIEGIFNTISTVGAMAEAEDEAVGLSSCCASAWRGSRTACSSAGWRASPPRRVVCLEWLEPPFASGHWVPEQVRRAGGWDLLGVLTSRRARRRWDDVRDVEPEQLLLMPCGFDAARTADEWACAARHAADWMEDLARRPRGRGLRARRLGVFQPAGAARRWTASRSWPSCSTRAKFTRRACPPTPGCRSAPDVDVIQAPRVQGLVQLPVVRPPPPDPIGDSDLEGYALLCPDCIGRAQDNEFLRFRLREGLRHRSDRQRTGPDAHVVAARSSRGRRAARLLRRPRRPSTTTGILRRGRYSHGVIDDAAWAADMDTATLWLDGQPLEGEIVELAAGTGWWSPLLAQKASSCGSTTRSRSRSNSPASVWSRMGCARAYPRTRCVGRAGPPGRRAILRLLAQPRVRAPDWPSSWPSAGAGSNRAGRLAFIDSRRDSRVERHRPSAAGRRHVRPPSRRRPRIHDRQGLLGANRSRGRVRGGGLRAGLGQDDEPLLPAGRCHGRQLMPPTHHTLSNRSPAARLDHRPAYAFGAW